MQYREKMITDKEREHSGRRGCAAGVYLPPRIAALVAVKAN